MKVSIVAYLCLLWAISTTSPVFSNAKLELLSNKLNFPVNFAYPKNANGKTYIVEHTSGKVRILQNNKILNEVFLDISDRITQRDNAYEDGFNSLAFSPNYQQDKAIYVHYIDKKNDLILSQFTVTNDFKKAELRTEIIILKVKRIVGAPVHHCGHIAFGPKDKFLYVCIGDTDPPDNPSLSAQNLTNLPGKILRIDVSQLTDKKPYIIPADNPFIDRKKIKSEIWIYGLRNPWKFSFDRRTGDLYVPDISNAGLEELNFLPSASKGGHNLGWPVYEGDMPFRLNSVKKNKLGKLQPPIFTYPHMTHYCAIIGGQVYYGKKYKNWQGTYVFSDHCTSTIWGLRRQNNKFQVRELLNPLHPDTPKGPKVHTTAVGELSNLEIGLSTLQGSIYQLHFPPVFEKDWFPASQMYTGEKNKLLLKEIKKIKESKHWKIGSFIGNMYEKMINLLKL